MSYIILMQKLNCIDNFFENECYISFKQFRIMFV
jgi:hypothetical protein